MSHDKTKNITCTVDLGSAVVSYKSDQPLLSAELVADDPYLQVTSGTTLIIHEGSLD